MPMIYTYTIAHINVVINVAIRILYEYFYLIILFILYDLIK